MSSIALRLIAENKQIQAPFLDLGDCNLTELPDEIGELVWLQRLTLSNEWWDADQEKWEDSQNNSGLNNITSLGTGIAQLVNLGILWCNGSYSRKFGLEDLSPLSNLPKLSRLYISETSVSDLSPLKGLANLTRLDIGGTAVIDLEPLSGLTTLKRLNINKTDVVSIQPLKNLNQLSHLHLRESAVTQLDGAEGLTNLLKIEFGATAISDLRPLASCTELEQLNARSTKVSDLSTLHHLKNLQQLFLSNCPVFDLSPLRDLEKILLLDIKYTQVADLSPILHLVRKGIPVRWKDTSLSIISSSAYEFDKPRILVEDCPLSNPPAEIARQGNDAILRYFEAKKKQGSAKIAEAKIVVVGAGEAGKTTLIRKMFNQFHPVPNPEDKRTMGIQLNRYSFSKMSNDVFRDITAYIWDFGGQEIYHSLHQFFITPDTLYILVNDNRKNDTDFYYWLNIIQLRSGKKSPVLLVFNAKDNTPRQINPKDEVFKIFENILPEIIDINFADKDTRPLMGMKKIIEEHFTTLVESGKVFPSYWVKVRDELIQLEKEHIEWDEFMAICQQHGIEDQAEMNTLAKTLHNLGVFLYFSDIFGLENLLILDTQWCIDAVYAVFDAPEVREAYGRFDEKMLLSRWAGSRYKGNHLALLRLGQHFDIWFQIEGSNEYIAPQLLPLAATKDPEFPEFGHIIHYFEYTFMPSGLLSRLMARMSKFIKLPFTWRNGVTLVWDDQTFAEITENQFIRRIEVRVAGNERNRRLSEIRKTILDLHQMFPGLQYKELVSCNCISCTNSQTPTTFDLEELLDYDKFGEDIICRNGERKKIPASQILEGVEYTDIPRLFISYSHNNEALKDEFRAMMRPLERGGKMKIWDDRWLLPGDNWNQEVFKNLSEANVIVLLLSPQFFNNDHIYDYELSKAIQRYEKGEVLLIGIVVSACMWEATPLQKIQILPDDGIPLESSPNRNEVWKKVAQKITEAIAVYPSSEK